MEAAKYFLSIFFAGIIIVMQSGCTENPFGTEEISTGKRQISGSVVLSDNLSPEGVYVWLESFNIGTRTDENGQFQVTLPPPATQGGSGGVSGAFNLYYYLTNYELNFTKVVTRNGEFLFSQGEINKNGELNQPVELKNFLNINTIVEPSTISTKFAGQIDVNIHLITPLNDSTTVVFPSSIPLGRPFGTIILKNLDTEELFPFRVDQGDQYHNSHIIGHIEQVLQKPISTVQGVLPVGRYEVIPHMLIKHEELPEGLLESLGSNLEEPGADYLNIPIRREGGQFEVVE